MARTAPDNLRLSADHGLGAATLDPADDSIEVMIDDEPVEPDATMVETSDGAVIINFGRPTTQSNDDDKFSANLADKIDEHQLGVIANDLIEGIEADDASRAEWVAARREGMQLLALVMEQAVTGAEGAPVEGMSTVRHPMLLEAVIRFQSNARAELLPTDGPVKVRNDDPKASLDDNPKAEALAKDLNHYLTTVATEYYPDTDRMLFRLGFGGSEFRKAYHCPLRRRPVLETVDANHLIVSNTATDLKNALRVTHWIPAMKRSTMKRMQLAGVYRDISLDEPAPSVGNAVEQGIEAISGMKRNPSRPQDNPYEVYECYTELDLSDFGFKEKGAPDGLPLPYRVTIEKTSRRILEIRRNWLPDDPDYTARETFTHYVYIPGFGFYGYGLLQLMGQITRAVTAAWREMLDAGMFANFPGFLLAKGASRQQTNTYRIPPGGSQTVDVGTMKISDAVMPLPYKEPGPAMMAFVEHVAQTGQRIGGTAEIQVGEGRQDAPVGTTLALIEQATKPLAAIHKRLYSAQEQELQLLRNLFKEKPDALLKNKKQRHPWTAETLIQALDDTDLVPVADPNTASHMERLMKAVALEQLAQAHPDLYDERAVQTLILSMINIGTPDQLFKREGEETPDGETMKAMAEFELKNRELGLKERAQQLDEALAGADLQGKQLDVQAKGADTQAKVAIAQLKIQSEAAKSQMEQQKLGLAAAAFAQDQKEADRDHERQLLALDLDHRKTDSATQLAREAEAAETERQGRDLEVKQRINDADNATAMAITAAELKENREIADKEIKAGKEQAKIKARATPRRNMRNGNGINPGPK